MYFYKTSRPPQEEKEKAKQKQTKECTWNSYNFLRCQEAPVCNESTVSYYFTHTRTVKIKRIDNNKSWQECKEIEILTHCWRKNHIDTLKNYPVVQMTKQRSIIRPNNSTLMYIPRRTEKLCP